MIARLVGGATLGENAAMTPAEPFATDSTPALSPLAPHLEALAAKLGVKSVLVMRSEPDSMVVAATAGEATQHYTVGAAGKKAGDDSPKNLKPMEWGEQRKPKTGTGE